MRLCLLNLRKKKKIKLIKKEKGYEKEYKSK